MASRSCVSRRRISLRATDRLTVPGDEDLGIEADHAVDGMEVRDRAADLVAPDGVEVRDVAEQRTGEVPGEHGAILGQPHHERVGGLAPRRRVELEATAAEGERVSVDEGGGDHRLRRLVRAIEVAEIAAPELLGATGEERLQAPPVLADVGVVRLRDGLHPGSVELRPSTDVIGVTLGEHDHPERVVAHRSEAPLDLRRLEVHAGVDQHVAVGGGDQVAVGDALRHEDAVTEGHGVLRALPLP